MMRNETRPFNILIVDDIPRNIQVAASILRSDGYRMAFAQSGETALSQVKTNTFDLILLDIMMPGMDGFQVCQHLKQNPETRDIPIIFLTAKSDTESIVKGFELGAIDYVTKPFNGAELSVRVRTHLELNRSRQLLHHANATKDKFFTIISHDLKNPFSSLIELSRHLINRYDQLAEQRRKEYIKTIYDTSKQTYQLLINLLDWSRIQTNTMVFNPMEVGLHAIAYETLAVLQSTAEKKQIHIHFDIDPSTTVYADRDMVSMVIRNLVSNAIKFTPPGGTIHIESESSQTDEQISVSDTGVGILPQDMEKLFRIDVHHRTPGTENELGTGLGLILCKEFIEKNGGHIWVESEPGKGSRFIFTLPRHQVA